MVVGKVKRVLLFIPTRVWLHRIFIFLIFSSLLLIVTSSEWDLPSFSSPTLLPFISWSQPIQKTENVSKNQTEKVLNNNRYHHYQYEKQIETINYHPIYRQVITNEEPVSSLPPGWPPEQNISSIKETYDFFKNILIIIIVSPVRFNLTYNILKHYKPFFRYITFCSSINKTIDGIIINGYNVVYGNMQYLAASRIVENITKVSNIYNKNNKSKLSFPFEGFLFCADDLLLNPWAISGSKLNKSSIWANIMGISHLRSSSKVFPSYGMSAEKKFRHITWPYFPKNRRRMLKVIEEGGLPYQNALKEAALKTPREIFTTSAYPKRLRNLNQFGGEVMFYTIVDAYYVPKHLVLKFVQITDHMARYFIHMECAIPTTLRILQSTHEILFVQYYWSSTKAEDCIRSKWSITIHGFHRCRHDHKFSNLIYANDSIRYRLAVDREYTEDMRELKGLE